MSEIEAALTFIVPQDTKPYFLSSALTGGDPEVHFQTERRAVQIRDMRTLAGKLSLDKRLLVSRRAARQRPSRLGLGAKTRIRVKDAIMAMITKSANDAAVVMAEALGRSENAKSSISVRKVSRSPRTSLRPFPAKTSAKFSLLYRKALAR